MNIDKMLDLSFLTEEEYENVMKVLQRDAELKKKDGDRIRLLKGSIKDEKKKKFVTGEWFEEVKAQRYSSKLDGPDLVRVSVRKKNKLGNETTEQRSDSIPQLLQPETTDVFSTETPSNLGEERFVKDTVAEKEKPQTLAKPKGRLPLVQPLSTYDYKAQCLSDTLPIDSDIGLGPVIDDEGLQLLDTGCETHLPERRVSKLLEKEFTQPQQCITVDSPEAGIQSDLGFSPYKTAFRAETSANLSKNSSQEEKTDTPSKIPVKKTIKRSVKHETNVVSKVHDQPKPEPIQKDSFKSPDLPTKGDSGKVQKGNFTISSLKEREKEEVIITSPLHFKSLKNFWEKGAESSHTSSETLGEGQKISSEKLSSPEFKKRLPVRLRRSYSVQPGESQTPEAKPVFNASIKSKPSTKKGVFLSSSEEESSHVNSVRKVTPAPRSSYNKNRGPILVKSMSLNEANRREESGEETRQEHRGSRRSKLPVRISSLHMHEKTALSSTPSEDKEKQNISEPKVPLEEEIIPEKVQQKMEPFHSRVLALLEAEPQSEDDDDDEIYDTIMKDYMQKLMSKANGLQHEDEQFNVSDVEDESSKDKGIRTNLEIDESANGSPVIKALARANSIIAAKSLMNIYTTTETYNKPPVITCQLLEPVRAKELSKSTPALVSESESDTASELSFRYNWCRKTNCNDSHSSDMASVSSVSGSVLSVYSGDFGSVDTQGSVQFALDYNEKSKEFQIYVTQCKDLATVDERKERSDPYVKTYLLPDKARMGKRKTSVKKRTVNPVYNEILRSLSIRNGVDHCGVMNLSIKYIPPGTLGPKNPPTGEVHIWVKDARDLPQLRPSGVDSFVKCYVLPDTSKKSYQKTRIVKKDQNPLFNHTIVYDGFHTEDLKDACVELTVWDHEKLTNHFLGGIRLGMGTGISYGIPVDWMDSTQEEVALWQEITSNPNEWIEATLPLRSSLAGKRKFRK
ncbi:synaptotagmin-like protein 2 isoform X2 [Latimeria chalumnae]|uniref:synaptotagmin-like protein 2 isoform X2 n=1 Tax=Latimeria chalumnae TaxID=7897 RepID=UPI0006D93DF5|nr:PREDICTED: synaptotagmin-like protein 2 isoform X2 [Latimeria chalumnae]|eukprot:XP_014343280.1 PREDICTED: synaptotagmin-like protein 2 isoform X2 [Latimeria chalumnae]